MTQPPRGERAKDPDGKWTPRPAILLDPLKARDVAGLPGQGGPGSLTGEDELGQD